MSAILLTRFKEQTLLSVLAGSVLIALSAYVSIPLYFTPVPLTAQTLAVMAVGILFGSRVGFLSVLAYLFEGALGLPVFAGGGFGLLTLLGFKAGYLWSFAIQAYLAGLVVEKGLKGHLKLFSAFLAISLIQLMIGTFWLQFYVETSAWVVGFYPFVVGAVLKAAAAAYLAERVS